MIPADLVPPDCPWPIVLGFDPGTRVAGYGALLAAPNGPRLVCCGVIRMPAKAAVATRLARLEEGLEELLRGLRPTVVAVETAFHAKNAQSALRIGEARGVVLATVARAGVALSELSPATAKKAVVGNGAGSKEQVAAMVATILGTGALDVPLDATDALALALAELTRERQRETLGSRSGALPHPG